MSSEDNMMCSFLLPLCSCATHSTSPMVVGLCNKVGSLVAVLPQNEGAP